MIFWANLGQNSTRKGFNNTKWKPQYFMVVSAIAFIWNWKAKKFSLDECIDNKYLKTFRVNLTKV